VSLSFCLPWGVSDGGEPGSEHWAVTRPVPQPQSLFLELRRRSGASPASGVDLGLRVKSHGRWEVVDDDKVVLMPDKVMRCRFDLNHEVFPSGFYDVRWFRAEDRGKLVEITRERFQLRNSAEAYAPIEGAAAAIHGSWPAGSPRSPSP
jgi:hypothetical protein